MNCKFLLQFLKVLTVGCTSENINKVYVPIIGQGEFKNITVSLQMENLWNISTLNQTLIYSEQNSAPILKDLLSILHLI